MTIFLEQLEKKLNFRVRLAFLLCSWIICLKFSQRFQKNNRISGNISRINRTVTFELVDFVL